MRQAPGRKNLTTVVKFSTMLIFAVVLAGCSTPKETGRVSAEELRDLVPGAVLKGTVAGGGGFEGTYFRDGTMAISTDDDADNGVWAFEDDTVCLTWNNWRQGERYCIYWQREAEGYAAYFMDGRLSTRFVILQ